MNLILYSNIKNYSIIDNLDNTKLVRQLETEFMPLLRINFCKTLGETYYELKINDKSIKRKPTTFENDIMFFRDLIRPNIDEKKVGSFTIQSNFNKILAEQKNSFTCPQINYNKTNYALDEHYKLLYNRNSSTRPSKEDLLNAEIQVCNTNYGKGTQLHKLCIEQAKDNHKEKNITETFSGEFMDPSTDFYLRVLGIHPRNIVICLIILGIGILSLLIY